MNTDKKVFNKLFDSEKVELESQRIELGLMDDAAALTSILKGLNQKILSNGEKANELYSIVQKDGEKALLAFSDASKLYDRIAQMFKDLGLPATPQSDPKVKAMFKEMDDLLTYRKRYSF